MGWRGGGDYRELVFNGYRVSALQEEKCVGMDGGDGCAPVRRGLMSPTMPLKMVVNKFHFTCI